MSTYVIERATIGILAQHEVDVVRMPRARFLSLVDGLLEEYPELRGQLRPVAEAMVSYPMGEWLNEERGCGCVVGEYLVATGHLARAELVRRMCGRRVDIEDLLAEDPNADALREFGEHIDRELRQEIRRYLQTEGLESRWQMPAAVVIDDEMDDDNSTEGEAA